jgi:hypothetical protein
MYYKRSNKEKSTKLVKWIVVQAGGQLQTFMFLKTPEKGTLCTPFAPALTSSSFHNLNS